MKEGWGVGTQNSFMKFLDKRSEEFSTWGYWIIKSTYFCVFLYKAILLRAVAIWILDELYSEIQCEYSV
jgi:hypothetical protein